MSRIRGLLGLWTGFMDNFKSKNPLPYLMNPKDASRVIDLLESHNFKYAAIGGFAVDAKLGINRKHDSLELLFDYGDMETVNEAFADYELISRFFNQSNFKMEDILLQFYFVEMNNKDAAIYEKKYVYIFPQDMFLLPNTAIVNSCMINVVQNPLLRKWGSDDPEICRINVTQSDMLRVKKQLWTE